MLGDDSSSRDIFPRFHSCFSAGSVRSSVLARRLRRSPIVTRGSGISVGNRGTTDRNRARVADRNMRAADATVGSLRALMFINSKLREGECTTLYRKLPGRLDFRGQRLRTDGCVAETANRRHNRNLDSNGEP